MRNSLVKLDLDLKDWILLFLAFFTPSFGLSYILSVPNVGKLTLPFGQYIFFFFTLTCGANFFIKIDRIQLCRALLQPPLLIFFGLFLIGVFVSSKGLWGFRLLAIITIISFVSVVLATFLYRLDEQKQKLAMLLASVAFVLPVFGAFILETIGPINVGITLYNIKQSQFNPARWHFLYSSANGFGFSAALVFSAFYVAGFMFKNTVERVVYFALAGIGLYALIYSGTRASFIFALICIFVFHLFHYKVRFFLYFILLLSLVVFALISIGGVSNILDFLRINGNLNQISSTRWVGIENLWDLFTASPFSGLGFGAADNGLSVNPTNIFYVALLVEIGIFGFVGAVGFIFLPILFLGKKIFIDRRFNVLQGQNYLAVLSTCIIFAFIPYLMFEFNVLRVSAVNQLFFFCWGFSLLSLQK